MSDSDIDDIIKRDRIRRSTTRKDLPMSSHPNFIELERIIRKIIYAPGCNHGNIYADELTNKLLKTGKIQLVS